MFMAAIKQYLTQKGRNHAKNYTKKNCQPLYKDDVGDLPIIQGFLSPVIHFSIVDPRTNKENLEGFATESHLIS